MGERERVLRVLLRLIFKWDKLERWAVRNCLSCGVQAAKEAKEKYLDILRKWEE